MKIQIEIETEAYFIKIFRIENREQQEEFQRKKKKTNKKKCILNEKTKKKKQEKLLGGCIRSFRLLVTLLFLQHISEC